MVNYVKVGNESNFGTHVATTGINVSDVSVDVDRSLLIEENIDNFIAATAYGGPLKISGSIEGTLRPKQLELMLKAFMGDATGPYTFSVPTSMSIDIGEELMNQEMQCVGCGISKLSLTFAAKEFATFTADFFAKNYSLVAFSEPTITAEDPAVFYNASLTIGGTPSTEIKEITVDLDRKLDDDNFVLNDFTLHRLARTGVTSVTGSITFAETAFDEYRRALTGTTSGTAVDANNTVGSAALIIICTNMAGTESFRLSMPVSVYGKGGKKISKVSEIEKIVDFTATGSGVTFTVAA
ncbi:MAG: phage tail tube protein [Candidatus Babeliales bacterium]